MLVSPRVQTFPSPILDHWFQFLPATMKHERESCAKPGATRAFRKLLLPHRGAILRMHVRTLPHTTIRPGTLRVGRERKSTSSQIQRSSTTHAHRTLSPARPNPPPKRIPPATSGSRSCSVSWQCLSQWRPRSGGIPSRLGSMAHLRSLCPSLGCWHGASAEGVSLPRQSALPIPPKGQTEGSRFHTPVN